jgi:nucleoside 2-deoxyribosyltransferase
VVAKFIYLIGSLRNPKVPEIAAKLREAGHEVFDDWFAAGPEADDHWQRYEQARGHSFAQALAGHAGQHVYRYDRSHLDRMGVGVLVLPAGKSGHLELGYMIGQGKPGYILLDGEPERFDVMYNFATGVFTNLSDLLKVIGGSIDADVRLQVQDGGVLSPVRGHRSLDGGRAEVSELWGRFE